LESVGIYFGGDYNPEQWPEDVWPEDVALMREAGVNLVTVGVFAWSWLEPEEGKYEFGWLDRVLDGLQAGGIAVDLATATASPPPWFSHAYPQTLPIDPDGRRLTYGSRQAFCPSSPIYRAAALRLAGQLAARYGDHPALRLWHVHNEYACHNARCYCDTSAAAFREWLRARYGDLEGLNTAWGTAFWSQRYTDWAQVLPPRATPAIANPAQLLDFRRFSSDEHLANFIAERDLLLTATPEIPITTNLIPGHTELDQWAWGRELPIVSTDHYLMVADAIEPAAQTAYAADLSRSLGAGKPWLLMEHSTSAVNWQPHNAAKATGALPRESVGHVARGADGVLFFQWRASRSGAERWHSGMLPHAGTDSKIWRDVLTLGRHVRALGEVAGSRVEAEVAVLLDFPSGWALENAGQPSRDMDAFGEIKRWHAALWRAGITTDLAPPDADLSRYRLVLAPALYAVSDPAAKNLRDYVAGGGHLLVGPYSGIVDELDRVRLGGYPGAFADLLGVRIEEFFPLVGGETVTLSDGSVGTLWSELGESRGAEVLSSYTEGSVQGSPAIARNAHDGGGLTWYVGTRLVDESLAALLGRVIAESGATPPVADRPAGIDAVRRRHAGGTSYLFLFNHASAPAQVAAAGVDLLTGTEWPGPVRIEPGQILVLREEPT
jgi:beta-galactosidase